MTTAVKVDAHAGWPVLVVVEHGEPGQPKTVTTVEVAPNTEHTFYIHSGLRINSIFEQPMPQKAEG